MGDSEKILVKYVANADQSEGTAALSFDDGRPNLEITKLGEITSDEFGVLNQRVVLEVIDPESDEAKAYYEAQAAAAGPDPNADLEGASKKDLEAIAGAENPPVDLSSAKNNAERADLIRTAREGSDPLNPAGLPATATAGPTGPAVGGGSAAGPEGAAAQGAGGGPSTAPGDTGGTTTAGTP
jgi:hypothetical protein